MRKRRVTDKQSKNAVKQAFGVIKEIVISAMAEIWKELPSLLEEFFLCFCHHRMAEMSEAKQSEVELLSHRRYKVVARNAIRGQCYGWNYTRYGG